MSKDYKNSRKNTGAGFSGTTGLVIGLAIGLAVALAVYLRGGAPPQDEPAETPVPAKQTAADRAEETGDEHPGRKYDFYEMLPKFEVVVPEREKAVSSDARPTAIQKPGAYVLQVGSYRNLADAERVRAQLARQGIDSKIQKVSVDNDAWHRVRIGPIADLGELNRMRSTLRQADVEAIVVKVGE